MWLKAYENENAKTWEDESALFSRLFSVFHKFYSKRNYTSETCLILITFVLASCLIFNIEAFKKACLDTQESTSSLSLSFQYVVTVRLTLLHLYSLYAIYALYFSYKNK